MNISEKRPGTTNYKKIFFIIFFLVFGLSIYKFWSKSHKTPKSEKQTNFDLETAIQSFQQISSQNPRLTSIESALAFQPELGFLMQEIEVFERQIPDQDKEAISRGLQYSRGAVAGFTPIIKDKCTNEDYRKITEQLSINQLVQFGLTVTILGGLLEDLNRPVYYQRISEFIKSGRCQNKNCKTFEKFYDSALKQIEARPSIVREQVKKPIEKLLPLWKTETSVMNNTFQLASSWPNCFGYVTVTLFNHINRDLTSQRAKFLLHEVKRLQIKDSSKFIPESFSLISTDVTKSSLQDGWGSDLSLKISDSGYSIISAGPDMTFETGDDLEIAD